MEICEELQIDKQIFWAYMLFVVTILVVETAGLN